MPAEANPAQSERQIERWTILTCPSCGGLVQPAAAITTHVGDCPRRFTMFVAREVEVVPAERVGNAEEALDEMRAELAAAEQVLVAADRLREAYEAMTDGRDLGRLPDWEPRNAA